MKLKMNVMLCFLALYDTLRNKFFDEIIKKYNIFNDFEEKKKNLFVFSILIHLFVNQLLLLFLRL